MSLQSIKTKLLTVGLFALSACGTIALFGCVPVIARMLSDGNLDTPPRFQAFPQTLNELRSEERPQPFNGDLFGAGS